MKYSACAIVAFFAISGFLKAEQPYVVKNEAVECFDGLKETVYHCELKVIGRQRLINGTFSIGDDLYSDHYSFQIDLYFSPLGDAHFKRLPMGVARMAICEGSRAFFAESILPSFIEGETTNFPFIPVEGLCPIPKGEYFFKNLEYDTDSWPNQLPRGLLKGVFTIFKDGVNVGGAAQYLRVEDRN